MTNSTTGWVSQAAAYLMIANTPIFLVNKLRRDPQIITFANNSSAEDLIANINRCLQHCPSDIYEEVEPYVYLAALAIHGDARSLKEVMKLNGERYGWFNYLAKYLFEITPATTTSINPFVAAAPNSLPRVVNKYTTPTTASIYKTGRPLCE